MIRSILPILVLLGMSNAALAQHHSTESSPYAGLEKRRIKALSDQQIDDLKNGRGMALALSAELNGYPGPAHVLELADGLELSSDQRDRFRRLRDSMRSEAIAIGTHFIELEEKLDHLFAHRKASVDSLDEMTAAMGQTQARLRSAHLKYHLLTVEILTPEQISMYKKLRGYAAQ